MGIHQLCYVALRFPLTQVSRYILPLHLLFIMRVMRVGHVFFRLLFLWALPVSERPLSNISFASRHLTSF